MTVTILHEAVYETVHYEEETAWVIDREAWDEPYEITQTVSHWVCKGCEANGILTFLDGMTAEEEDAHAVAHMVNGEEGGSYLGFFTEVTGTGRIRHEAESHSVTVRPARDETVLIREAWEETVTAGYRCPGCGAVR